MEKLKVNFVDFWSGFDKVNNDFYRILSEKYEIEISDKPDYLFYSVFGYEHTKYDCVRIFFTGECIVPDFNICDYAIGFDNITFGDRYTKRYFRTDEERKARITLQGKRRILWQHFDVYAHWWLRTPSIDRHAGESHVTYKGEIAMHGGVIMSNGYDKFYDHYGVRPVMYIDAE